MRQIRDRNYIYGSILDDYSLFVSKMAREVPPHVWRALLPRAEMGVFVATWNREPRRTPTSSLFQVATETAGRKKAGVSAYQKASRSCGVSNDCRRKKNREPRRTKSSLFQVGVAVNQSSAIISGKSLKALMPSSLSLLAWPMRFPWPSRN